MEFSRVNFHGLIDFVFILCRLESPTRSLLMNAGQDILIKSGAGNIDASCLNDIRINSRGDGSVSAHHFNRNLSFQFLKVNRSMVGANCRAQSQTTDTIISFALHQMKINL